MITERLMAQGSFDLQLRADAPRTLWWDMFPFGHIVITPQRLDIDLHSDAQMLAASRYTGVLLRKRITNDAMTLEGAHCTWWLGDDENIGPQLSNADLSGSLATAIAGALANTDFTVGTIDSGLGTHSGTYDNVHALTAIRTICADLGCEFRINNNFSVDAGLPSSLYNTVPLIDLNAEGTESDDETIQVVLSRELTGSDGRYIGFPPEQMESLMDGSPYAARIILHQDGQVIDTEQQFVPTSDAFDEGNGPVGPKQGSIATHRELAIEGSFGGNPVIVSSYLTSLLNDHTVYEEIRVSTEWYEIDGNFALGDAAYAYDPPAFDAGSLGDVYQIWYRGQAVPAVPIRFYEVTWAVRPGMGVYYRSPRQVDVGEGSIDDVLAAEFWTDISEHVSYEDNSQSLGRLRNFTNYGWQIEV